MATSKDRTTRTYARDSRGRYARLDTDRILGALLDRHGLTWQDFTTAEVARLRRGADRILAGATSRQPARAAA